MKKEIFLLAQEVQSKRCTKAPFSEIDKELLGKVVLLQSFFFFYLIKLILLTKYKGSCLITEVKIWLRLLGW